MNGTPRKLCLILLGAVLFGPALALAATPPAAETAVVFLVRHAEKERDGSRDPELTGTGRERAELLGSMLLSAGVTHLYSTDTRRTRATLAPLAAALGLEPELVNDVAKQVALLRELPPGAVAVVAGHSNTIPELVRALGGEVGGTTPKGYLGDQEYDRLFQVILPRRGKSTGRGRVQTLELRFGEAAPARP